MYISLHNRSAYSFGSALTTPEQLAAFAHDQRMPAIALTDLHGLYAAVEFQETCRKACVKSIFGAEMILADGLAVTLLAQALNGYGNLCRLISQQHLQGANTTDLCAYAEDVICIINQTDPSHTASPPSHATGLNGQGPPSHLSLLSSQFSVLGSQFRDRLYVALAIHSPDDVPSARRRAAWADAHNIPVVATCESRCLHREQTVALRALASIGTLTLFDRPHPDKPEGTWHLRTPAEMDHLFRRHPDALANTLRIAEQCNVTLDLDQNRFPTFTSPDGRSAMEHLRALCTAGCRRRYVEQPQQKGIGGRRPTLDEAITRLERELTIIDQVHYAEYFLVFHEIVEHCRAEGIATLARGSAADSLVCYALGVSHACPFRFDLPFDRFLNPERAKFSKMADIDLDLPWDRRDEVIRWVYERWGSDRVAMIGSPNTFHARAAVAELGKVFGLPAHEVYRISKRLPHSSVHNLPQYLASSPEARDLPIDEEPYRTILNIALALDGLPRHWAMHPCGLVVAPEPITGLIPVQPSPKGPLVAQYDMDAIEALGFIKIDLLGQAGLSVLRDATAEIERTTGQPIDLEHDVDYSDAPTWDLIASGNARGVHHIESPAMTSLLQQSASRDIDCLTAIVAIIRPGAANQGSKEVFARRHAGLEAPTYAHPSLRPILENTYGLMVFEEHIMQIATEFAGLNLGQADVLRRALNKENSGLIIDMGHTFVDSALSLGRSKEEIKAVWSLVAAFSGFMFNKAHSAEYAVEAFQGAWLKLRWPAHYLAAILSNYRGFYAHSPTLPQILYVMEALRRGISFRPPCVNASRSRFSVEGEGTDPGDGWERREHGARRDRREERKLDQEGCPTSSCGFSELLTPEQSTAPQASEPSIAPQGRRDVATGGASPPQRTSATRGHQSSSCIPPRRGGGLFEQKPSQFRRPFGARNVNNPDFHGFRPPRRTSPVATFHRPAGAIQVATETQNRCTSPEDEGDQGGSPNERLPERVFIRIPVAHINGLSESFIERYRAIREHGPFTSLEDFMARCRPGEAESLALLDAGALDALGPSRPELFWHLRRLTRHPQGSGLFSEKRCQEEFSPESPPVELTIPDARQIATRETELLGFPVTLHPLEHLGTDDKGRRIDWSLYTPVDQLANYPNARVHVCGLMVADRVSGVVNGGLLKFVTLADRTGFVETILFPDVYQRFGHLTVAHAILAATGIVEPFETGSGFTLRVQNVCPPTMI